MADGAAHNAGLVLCTDCFSIQDVVRLMNVLIVRYDLKCSIRENNPGQYRIYILKQSMDKLRLIVEQHMEPSMVYKILRTGSQPT